MDTLIVLVAPVVVERSTRWAPPVPVTIVAVTPGLLPALLIALAIPVNVLLVLSTVTSIDLPPTSIVSLPVPSLAVASNAADDRLCDAAICLTSIV